MKWLEVLEIKYLKVLGKSRRLLRKFADFVQIKLVVSFFKISKVSNRLFLNEVKLYPLGFQVTALNINVS